MYCANFVRALLSDDLQRLVGVWAKVLDLHPSGMETLERQQDFCFSSTQIG